MHLAQRQTDPDVTPKHFHYDLLHCAALLMTDVLTLFLYSPFKAFIIRHLRISQTKEPKFTTMLSKLNKTENCLMCHSVMIFVFSAKLKFEFHHISK